MPLLKMHHTTSCSGDSALLPTLCHSCVQAPYSGSLQLHSKHVLFSAEGASKPARDPETPSSFTPQLSNSPAQLGRKFQGPQVISASSASSQNWPLPAAHFPEAEGWVGWCEPVIGGWEAGFLSSVHQACKVNSGVWGEKRLYGGGDASETEHA